MRGSLSLRLAPLGLPMQDFSSYSLYRCTHAKNSTARPRASNCGDKKNDYKVNTMPRKTQLGIAMFMALLVQCSPPSGPSEVTEENKEIVRRFIEVVNDQDFDLLDELMVSDFVRHSQPTPDVQVRSLEDFKVYLRQDAATTPDARVTTRFLVGEDDLVAFYGTYAGTQAAQWGPFPPSGKRMEVEMGGTVRQASACAADPVCEEAQPLREVRRGRLPVRRAQLLCMSRV